MRTRGTARRAIGRKPLILAAGSPVEAVEFEQSESAFWRTER
jgi:hypothetical protein